MHPDRPKRQATSSLLAIRRRTVLVDTPKPSATWSISRSLEKGSRRSCFIGGVSGIGVSQPMQVLARGLARQQADQDRDRLVDLGCAISTLRRLGRLSVPRWCRSAFTRPSSVGMPEQDAVSLMRTGLRRAGEWKP
jgi:hypothetical protein